MKRVVILFEGRSGCTHLVRLIQQHPACEFYGEELAERTAQGWESQLEWMTDIFDRGQSEKTHSQIQVVGFSTKLRDVCAPDALRAYIEANDVQIIRLFRRNTIKQTLSAIRAMQLARQHGIYNISVKNEDLKLKYDSIPPHIFERTRKWIEGLESALDRFIANSDVDVLGVAYEDLLHSRDNTVAEVFDFIGVETVPVVDHVVKHTADELELALPNYDELRIYYGGTKYRQMFESQPSSNDASTAPDRPGVR